MTAPGFVEDADAPGWRSVDIPAPCVTCGQPARMRDPSGKPRHRVDCDARVPVVPTSQEAHA